MRAPDYLRVLVLPALLAITSVSSASVAALAEEYSVPPPKVVVKMDRAEGAAGTQLKGTFTISIAEGWHCYPNPPSDPYCVPVYLSSGTPGFKLTRVDYPSGVVDPESGSRIYVGTVVIPFTVELPAKRGAQDFQIRMRYQQCDSSECLPPANLVGTVRLAVT